MQSLRTQISRHASRQRRPRLIGRLLNQHAPVRIMRISTAPLIRTLSLILRLFLSEVDIIVQPTTVHVVIIYKFKVLSRKYLSDSESKKIICSNISSFINALMFFNKRSLHEIGPIS